MIEGDEVFSAIRRGYDELSDASAEEICNYFSDLSQSELTGHVSNIKGILFEQEVVDALNDQGYEAAVFEATNHPATDIMILDGDEVELELQLKATDSTDYIINTLEANPDIPIIATHEVAQELDGIPLVFDAGIDNSALTDAVQSTITDSADAVASGVADVASSAGDAVSDALGDLIGDSLLPISPVGALLSWLIW